MVVTGLVVCYCLLRWRIYCCVLLGFGWCFVLFVFMVNDFTLLNSSD